jgi:hypothetical protein
VSDKRSKSKATRALRRAACLVLAAALAAACQSARSGAPPSADRPTPVAPDLAGTAVLVLPAQPAPGQGVNADGEPVAGLDGEIAFWLGDRAPGVRWVFPPAIDHALARAPMLDIQPRRLQVASFHRAQVRNIGDPLFGDLRRLALLFDARYALVPVSTAWSGADETGRVEITAALIDTEGGAVLWIGAVAGEEGAVGSAAVRVSAAEALVRALVR